MQAGLHEISVLLTAWSNGDDKALDDLVPMVYPELRRIARQYLQRRGPGTTFESAALANEAYLRFVNAAGLRCENRAHFFAVCAQMIRRILVDHARSKAYRKRGGGATRVRLDEVLLATHSHGVDLIALDQALDALSKVDPRKARMVELRYFVGLTVEETAAVLHVSAETVARDWRAAKAWLWGELSGITSPTELNAS